MNHDNYLAAVNRSIPTQYHSITDVFQLILAVIDALIPLVLVAAVAVFLWGLFKLLRAAGNEIDYEEGRNIMVYGIIGIFVMTAVWGLVAFLNGTFFPVSVLPPTV